MINKGLFTSDKNDWETPQDFFDELHKEFDFTLDAAASHENAKLDNYYTVEENGLEQKWEGRVFVNPPYGGEIKNWVEKAYKESLEPYNECVVMLIPSRTDTRYWHDYIFNIVDEFITPFMRRRRYDRWRLKEYGRAGFYPLEETNLMTYEQALEAMEIRRLGDETVCD